MCNHMTFPNLCKAEILLCISQTYTLLDSPEFLEIAKYQRHRTSMSGPACGGRPRCEGHFLAHMHTSHPDGVSKSWEQPCLGELG